MHWKKQINDIWQLSLWEGSCNDNYPKLSSLVACKTGKHGHRCLVLNADQFCVCLGQATKTETSELRPLLLSVLGNNTPVYRSGQTMTPLLQKRVLARTLTSLKHLNNLMPPHTETPSELQLKLCFKLCICLSATHPVADRGLDQAIPRDYSQEQFSFPTSSTYFPLSHSLLVTSSDQLESCRK